MSDNFKFLDISEDGIVNSEQLDNLVLLAKKNPSGVYRYNLHNSYTDKLQEMIICLNQTHEAVIHKHRDKAEVISILRGTCLIEFFNNNGEICNKVELSLNGNLFCRVNKDIWHRVTVKGDYCIIHEVASGPFDPNMMERMND